MPDPQERLKIALLGQKLQDVELLKKDLEVTRLRKDLEKSLKQAVPEKPKQQENEENKKWYVVFNGPFPNIYDDRYKAAQHCTKISGVTHKSYSTEEEEAKKAFEEYKEHERVRKGKEIYLERRTFSETTKNQPPVKSTMQILGRVTSSIDNFHITTRKEHELEINFLKKDLNNISKD